MADQDIGKLALFKNERKENDRQPDYRGTGEIDGHGKVKVSAWIRKSAKGQTYMSLAVQVDDYHPQPVQPPADQRQPDMMAYPVQPAQRAEPDEIDNTIPF